MPRITVTLGWTEWNALNKLAEREFRLPRSQAALIVQAELERQGLLPLEDSRDLRPEEGEDG